MSYDDDRKLFDDVKDFLMSRLPDTRFYPEEQKAYVLTDLVVVTGWIDGEGNEIVSWLGSGHTWANEGLLRQALDDLVSLREDD